MTRRRFIILGLISFLTTWIGFSFLVSFNWVVRRLIEHSLKDLSVEGGILKRFLNDCEKQNHWRQFSLTKKIVIRIHFYFPFLSGVIPYHHKYSHYKNIIVGDFLMSTNYFFNGQRTDSIKYIGLPNPYNRFCSNPFSDLNFLNND
jgi:hypothetical protein